MRKVVVFISGKSDFPSPNSSKTFSAKLGSRGRLVVPAAVRRKLGLRKGEKVEVQIVSRGESDG